MNQDKRTSRVIISVCLLGLFLLLFAGRLVQLQLVHGAEYAEQGKSISSASTRVEAARGEILDRNGNPLVTNRQGNSITFTAEKFPADNKDEIAQRNQLVNSLIELLESKGEKWIDNLPLIYDESGKIAFPENRESDVAYLKSDEILHVNSYATAQNCLDALIEKYSLQEYTPEQARKIASVYYEMHRLMFSKRTPYTFAEDVSTQTVAEIKEKSDFYQGVEIEVVPYREYVDGALAPHILGMVGAISENEYEKYKEKGYLQTDSIGKNGIEKAMEEYLRGTDGVKRTTKDDDGNITTEYVKEPEQGHTIILTIDKNLQKVANEALAKRIAELKAEQPDHPFCGAAVVIDVHTGEVLAAVSNPTYDISTYSKNYDELSKAENAPLWNRAMMSAYEPGSTMKPGIAITGLEEGVFNANTTYYCGGRGGYQRYRELKLGCSTGTHRNISVVHAIEISCNNFFFEAGYQIGIEKMNEYSRKFGLGQPTGIEIAEETGTLATPEYAESIGTPWRPGDTVQYAIGQSYNLFTPLQIANYAATIANGGTRYETHLVKSIKSYDYSKTVLEKEPVVSANLNISKSTIDLVHEGMRRVGDGTGFCARSFSKIKNGVKAAAKTGTSQVKRKINGQWQNDYNAVLITYAPVNDPEIAIGIVIESGDTGVDCAPVAAEIYNQYFSGSESAMDLPQEGNTLLQ